MIQTSKQRTERYFEFFKSVKLFKSLDKSIWRVLGDILEEETYTRKQNNTVILKEGEVVTQDHKFYIVKQGSVEWKVQGGSSGKTKGTLGVGEVFGEKGLNKLAGLLDNGEKHDGSIKRAATVTVKVKNKRENTVLLVMHFDTFKTFRKYEPVQEIFQNLEKFYEQINSGKQVKYGSKKSKPKKAMKDIPTKKSGGSDLDTPPPKKSQLKHIGVLGKGGFGLVTLEEDTVTKRTFALKAIRKQQVIELELQKHIISEKKVMQEMTNKFLVNLHETYNEPGRVYFLLDVCLGGELFTILRSRRYFNEPTARFFAASVVEGFAYMHSLNIIYRDLKPENLVLDSKGYLKIADFGFAKKLKADEGWKTYTLCGTPDYLCPEIVTGQGHGKGCDWWTLGILIYEMLASFPPFVADEPIETYRKIIRGRIRFPRYFSQEVRDLIRGLLHNKPQRRLGVMKHKGVSEPADAIRKHPWYSNFDWNALREGTLPAPIANTVKSPKDLSNFQQIDYDRNESAPSIGGSDDFGVHFESMWKDGKRIPVSPL